MSCWSPIWIKLSGDGPFNEESAVLASVTLSRLDPPTSCYLVVENGRSTHMGTVKCEDPTFCRQLYEVLQRNIGKLLGEIAETEMDVSQKSA